MSGEPQLNMHIKKFTIKIGSVPNREELVAEIYYEHEQWVEISQEEAQLIMKFYNPLNNKYWEFPCDEALNILERAKNKLLGLDSK